MIRVASLLVLALAISMPSEFNCRRLKLARRGDSEMSRIIEEVPDSKMDNMKESFEKVKIDSSVDSSKEKFEQSSMSFESSEELKKVKIPIKIVGEKSSEEKKVFFKRGVFEEKKPFLEVKKVPVKVELKVPVEEVKKVLFKRGAFEEKKPFIVEKKLPFKEEVKVPVEEVVKIPVKEEVKVPVEEMKKVVFKRGKSFEEKKPFIVEKKVPFKEAVKIPFEKKVKVPIKQTKKVFFKRGILEKKIPILKITKEKTNKF
jgi:hypothetical protein